MGACHPVELLVADKVVEQTASKLDYGCSCLGKGFGVAAKKAAEKSAPETGSATASQMTSRSTSGKHQPHSHTDWGL